MKIAVAGKGGAGKTTLAALLAHIYAEQGQPVLAVDADSSPCLGHALGFPAGLLARLRPISEMRSLINERIGDGWQASGSARALTPCVDDIPDRFSGEHRGIRLLRIGTVEAGGSGCLCPASVLLKALVTHIVLQRQEVLILDMAPGVEHLGRATAAHVDACLIVTEPGRRSLETAHRIARLAADIGLHRVLVVGNKIRSEADRKFIMSWGCALPVIGCLSYDPAVTAASIEDRAVYEASAKLVEEAAAIACALSPHSSTQSLS